MSIGYMIKNFTKKTNNIGYENYSRKIHKLQKDYKTIYVYPKYDANFNIIGIDVVISAEKKDIDIISKKIMRILSI